MVGYLCAVDGGGEKDGMMGCPLFYLMSRSGKEKFNLSGIFFWWDGGWGRDISFIVGLEWLWGKAAFELSATP